MDVFPRRGKHAAVVQEVPLKNFSLNQFRTLFELAANDAVVQPHEVTESQQEAIESLSGLKLDLKEYCYVVAAYAEADDAEGAHVHDLDWEEGGWYPSPRHIPGLINVRPVGMGRVSLLSRIWSAFR